MDIKKIIRSDFTIGSLFNLVGIFFLGISGLVLYFAIAKRYDAYTLGLFNLIFSIYIVVAQIGNFGIQSSVLIHIPKNFNDKKTCNELITSAIIIGLILSSFFSLIVFLGRNYIAELFKNQDISTAILYSVFGLWCFILNKLFLNIINGFNRMRAYAFFNSFRYFGMLIALLVVIFLNVPGAKMLVIFSISESLLLISIFLYSLKLFSFASAKQCFIWAKRHFLFGTKGMFGLIFAEMNTRIDVIMLGFFCSPAIIGIYSFASIIIEGLVQFPAILRTNISPIFTKLIFKGEKEKVKNIIKKGVSVLFPLMFLIGLLGILFYPFLVNTLLKKPEFISGWPVFAVLMAGTVIGGAYAPFSGLIIQSGHPGRQTIYVLLTLTTNIILNLILIPKYNMMGAAIATSISFILSVVYFKIFSRYFLKVKI